MRTTWSILDRVQRIAVERGTCSWPEASLTSLQGGASVSTPWLPEEDMRRSPLSEYISLHPSLTHHRSINPFENKVWEIYFYKEVCSFIEVRKLFDYVSACICICNRLYNRYKIKFNFNTFPNRNQIFKLIKNFETHRSMVFSLLEHPRMSLGFKNQLFRVQTDLSFIMFSQKKVFCSII